MTQTITSYPVRPPSEVEWEDVLLRLELMSRALRTNLEDTDPASVAAELREMVAREARAAEWLEGRTGLPPRESGTESAASPDSATSWDDDARLIDRFVSLRARNFAMVQRRGLEVWEWKGELNEEGVVTAFQLFSWLVQQDVRSLEKLRRGAVRAC